MSSFEGEGEEKGNGKKERIAVEYKPVNLREEDKSYQL